MKKGAEETRGEGRQARRPVVFCLIPEDLAPKLHELLRDHFADDPAIEVVVERRRQDQRSGAADRRTNRSQGPPGEERRLVRAPSGRRLGERRARLVPAAAPPALPRRARRYAEQLSFVRQLEPEGMRAEDLDTARLIARTQAGDREAFAGVYLRYFDRVYGYLRVVLNDIHDAEDATQQVFANVLEALPRYEQRREPFRAWLFVVVRNTALTTLEKQRRLEPVDPALLNERIEDESDTEEEAYLRSLDWITDTDLLVFVQRLPLVQRQVLLLRYVLDLPYAQIAKVLKRGPDDVRTIHRRAMDFLRARLTAIGRVPQGPGDRTGMQSRTPQAYVLRMRRFALYD